MRQMVWRGRIIINFIEMNTKHDPSLRDHHSWHERIKFAAALVWLAAGMFVLVLGLIAFSQINSLSYRLSLIEEALICPVERIKFPDGRCASIQEIINVSFPEK